MGTAATSNTAVMHHTRVFFNNASKLLIYSDLRTRRAAATLIVRKWDLDGVESRAELSTVNKL
jgi:hypothetical protein